MRSLHKYGTMVAVAALFAASGTVAQAADADLQSLQQQINMLQQQLKDVQAKQAAAPAAGPLAGAATVPANGGPGFLQYGSDAGGFVIPGTKTALKVGGNMNFQAEWDVDAGAGTAGGDSYAIRGGSNSGAGYALPGTQGARQVGRFTSNVTYSRLNFATRTPSEYGEIKFYVEGDFAGAASGGNQYNSNSHSFRLRHAYGTLGNLTVGQTWSVWRDAATTPNSILNNGVGGYDSGVRQPLISYRWDLDPAQKNQLYVSAENSYSDFLGADTENLAGNTYNNPTNFNTKYPDVIARFAHNESWGRTYLTGMVRDISVNTSGSNLGTAAGSVFSGPANDSTLGWGLTGGAKVYTGFGNAKNAAYVRMIAGQGIGRYMNFNSGSLNASAVVDSRGRLKPVYAAGYMVGYQHFFDTKNIWQANVIWADQKMWQKNSLMATNCAAGSVVGECGLATRQQAIELNLLWSPNSYVSMGPAYVRSNVEVAQGLNLVGVTGATRATSGTTAVDNKFVFTTNIGF